MRNEEKLSGRPLSLLIVDDSPMMRSFIRRVLALSGLPEHEIAEAGDGEEALRVMRGQRVDVVLSDINMPKMSGSELIRTMREEPALRDIPVIVLSTDSTLQRIESMRAYGARGYLSKPFPPEALRAEIERVLE
jgi:two-component system, chemotaxis family, chemotaxis protein CheY